MKGCWHILHLLFIVEQSIPLRETQNNDRKNKPLSQWLKYCKAR